MQVKAFFDSATYTMTYVVFDELTKDAVIVDPVLDFDPASGRVSCSSVDKVIAFVKSNGLDVHYILETHAHADHLSSAQILKEELPSARLAIGERIMDVQATFKPVYGLPDEFPVDGSQFDRLLRDGERVEAGSLRFDVMFTPGHTPACASYDFDGHVFTGDALFMPDYGTGRTDFPGGSASVLYDSIKRLYTLPDATKVFTGHDYQPNGRPLRYESTVAEEKRDNIHLNESTQREDFVRFRKERDATLSAPKLLHPSVQININAGHLPPQEESGGPFIKIPLKIEIKGRSS